jgi:MFS family permease
MQLLRGKKYNCDDEINEIKKNSGQNSSELSILEHLKVKATRKAFLIILTQFFFFQFTGINAVLFYTTTIFIEAGINIEPGIASIMVVSSQIIGTSFSAVLVDRFGRKILMGISTILMAFSHIAIGTYFWLKSSGSSVDHLTWLPIVSLSVFEIAFGCGIGPVSYVLLGELFNSSAKKVIAPIGKAFNLFLAFVVGLTFPILVFHIGGSATFFMFAGFSFLALLFTIFVIPETKGKSLNEIQEMLS